MWRSILFIIGGFPIALGAGAIAWILRDFKTGLLVMAIVMTASMAFALANLFFIRKLSTPDIFLPIPFAMVWSVVLLPFGFVSEYFNIASFLGSSLLFTLSLWWVREGKMSRSWLIFPALVFLYEMVPVNIPGPFDDIFGFGGSVTALIIQGIRMRFLRLGRKDEDKPVVVDGPGHSSRKHKKKRASQRPVSLQKALVVRN